MGERACYTSLSCELVLCWDILQNARLFNIKGDNAK